MTKEDRLYEQIKDLLEANLKPIRADIISINKAINGNGQPGLMQRVEKLEAWRWKAAGIMTALIFGLTFFKDQIITLVFARR